MRRTATPISARRPTAAPSAPRWKLSYVGMAIVAGVGGYVILGDGLLLGNHLMG